MEELSELHKWLKRQEEVGVVESSGSFSLEQSKAWEKLGKFQLPFDTAWALKFVQAASVYPSGVRLNIVQTRAESTFTFVGVKGWAHHLIERAIFTGTDHHEISRDLEHLSIGIRVLAQSRTTAFSLRYPDGKFVIWSGQEFVWQEDLPATQCGLEIAVCHFDIGESKSIFSIDNLEARSYAARIAKALSDYCHLSPIPVTLDSRTLNGFVNDPLLGKTTTSRPLAFLTSEKSKVLPPFALPAEGLWTLRSPEQPPKKIPALTDIGSAAILSCFLSTRNSGSFNLSYTSGMGESQVIWLVDGVCTKRSALDFSGILGLGLIVNCSGLETDLSGLSPIKTEARNQRFIAAVAGVSKELEKLRDVIEAPDLAEHRREQQSQTVRKKGWTFLSNPLVGLIEFVQMGFAYLGFDDDETFAGGVLDRSLERLLKKLQNFLN